MKITETTFRKMVTDYIHRRLEFKETMEWHSNFFPKNIILVLEKKTADPRITGLSSC